MLCSKDFFAPAVRRAAILAFAVAVTALAALGQNLPQPVNLSSAVGGGSNPVMALDAKGSIDVAWLGVGGVFFARSTDGGATFSTTTVALLTSQPPGLQMGLDSAGNITLFWPAFPDNTHPNGSAFLSHSTDAGLTFSAPKRFAPNQGITSSSIKMAVDPSGGINIVWLDSLRANLSFSRSTDAGVTFSAAARVWAVQGDLADLQTALGHDGQLYIFWTHIASNVQCDVLFSGTIDAGTTFSPAANISNTPGACSAAPQPVVDPSGGINVAWLIGNRSVSFSRSGDQGATFSAPTSVSGAVQFFLASGQQVAVDTDGEIDVVWSATLAASTVFLAHSEDQGATFSAPKILSLPPQPNNTGAGSPAIGIDRCGTITVAWSDDSLGTFSGDFDIFLNRSTDDGATFFNPLNLSNTPAAAEVISQMVVDSRGNANLTWTTVNPPFNVFFSRVPPFAARPGDFRITVSPEFQSANQGEVLPFQVTAHGFSLPGQTVNLSCSDLPPFVTCSFDQPSIVASFWGAVVTMTVNIPATLPAGSYVFAVNGADASTIDTRTVELIVTPPAAMVARRTSAASAHVALPDFRLTPDPRSAFAVGMPPSVCSSANQDLCAALNPTWPFPRWRRRRLCRLEPNDIRDR